MTTFYLAGRSEPLWSLTLGCVTKDYILCDTDHGTDIRSKHSPHLEIVRTLDEHFLGTVLTGNQVFGDRTWFGPSIFNADDGTFVRLPDDAPIIENVRGEYSIRKVGESLTYCRGDIILIEDLEEEANLYGDACIIDDGVVVYNFDCEIGEKPFKVFTNAGAWIDNVHWPPELDPIEIDCRFVEYHGRERNCLFGIVFKDDYNYEEVLLLQVKFGETDATLSIIEQNVLRSASDIQTGPEEDFATMVYVGRGARRNTHVYEVQYYRPDPVGPDTLRGAWLRAGVATAQAEWEHQAPSLKRQK